MLKNLDNLGEQTINRIATAALASQMQEAESFSVDVKIDPQELSQGIISSFSMDGKNVVTSKGFRATDFSLLIENISVHPFKALMGNIKLRQPALGNALLAVSPQDVGDALIRKLQFYKGLFRVGNLSCQFAESNLLKVQLEVIDVESEKSSELTLDFVVGYDINQKAIAFQNIQYSPVDESFEAIVENLKNTLLEILNLNSLMFSGMEFSVKNIKVSGDKMELMAIAKINSFPKAI